MCVKIQQRGRAQQGAGRLRSTSKGTPRHTQRAAGRQARPTYLAAAAWWWGGRRTGATRYSSALLGPGCFHCSSIER